MAQCPSMVYPPPHWWFPYLSAGWLRRYQHGELDKAIPRMAALPIIPNHSFKSKGPPSWHPPPSSASWIQKSSRFDGWLFQNFGCGLLISDEQIISRFGCWSMVDLLKRHHWRMILRVSHGPTLLSPSNDITHHFFTSGSIQDEAKLGRSRVSD